jgi:hypothetical protein
MCQSYPGGVRTYSAIIVGVVSGTIIFGVLEMLDSRVSVHRSGAASVFSGAVAFWAVLVGLVRRVADSARPQGGGSVGAVSVGVDAGSVRIGS